MNTRQTAHGIALAGHDDDCLCVQCMNADLNAHILTTRGEAALARIDLATDTDKASVRPERTRNLNAGQRVGRGYVRKISDKQVWLINKLIAERDTSGITLLPGQTLNPTEIPNMGVKGGSALIDKLFKCPTKSVAPVKTVSYSAKKELSGSSRQIEWITNGVDGKPSLLSTKGILTEADINSLYSRCDYRASAVISELLAMATVKATKGGSDKEELTEGIYTNGEKVFKAYVSQDGSKLLCKELIEESHEESVKVKKGSTERKTVSFSHMWEYRGMAFRFIKETYRKVDAEQARAYGQISGTCCRCGRRLVDETSVSNGIGPECATK